MKTKIHEKTKQAIILVASISLIAAAVPAIAGGDGPLAQGMDSQVQVESIHQASLERTIMIMDHEDAKFFPDSVAVNVGDSVVFLNQDGANREVPHAIVSIDSNGARTESFQSDLLYTGDSFEIEFEKTGIYHYADYFNPEVKGTIVVI